MTGAMLLLPAMQEPASRVAQTCITGGERLLNMCRDARLSQSMLAVP
jgi:hypothetical protein